MSTTTFTQATTDTPAPTLRQADALMTCAIFFGGWICGAMASLSFPEPATAAAATVILGAATWLAVRQR